MSNTIKSGSGSNLWTIDSNGAGKVALPTTANEVGLIGLAGINDLGSITGSKLIRNAKISLDGGLRSDAINLLGQDVYAYTLSFTANYFTSANTLAESQSSGFLNLNSSGLTTASSGVTKSTRSYFSVPSEGALITKHFVQLSAVGASNTEINIGRFQPNTATPANAPVDGTYCRINATGVFLVVNNNGSETTSTPVIQFTPIVNTTFKITIYEYNKYAELYINDVLYCTSGGNTGSANNTAYKSLPVSQQIRITAGGASVATILKVASWSIYSLGSSTYRSPALTSAINGGVGNTQQSAAQGAIATFLNNSNPTAAVPSNTTSTVLTALGGLAWETDTLAVNTDGIICSYQNLAPTATVPGKTLLINGITVSSFVQTALTGGGYNAQFAIAYGHTAISLATAESSAAKSPRKFPLGSYSVAAGAAALTQFPNITFSLVNPIVVQPGEFIQLIKRKIGTAPSAGVIAYTIGFDHVFLD